MKKPLTRNSAFLYTLKIWLTSLVGGPLGWLMEPPPLDEAYDHRSEMLLFTFVIALVCSIPCFLLLWEAVKTIELRTWRIPVKKLVTMTFSLVLAFVLIWVFLKSYAATNEPIAYYIGCAYLLALAVGVWVWRWPGRREVSKEEGEAVG